MEFVNKQPSRMLGQYFSKVWWGGQEFLVGFMYLFKNYLKKYICHPDNVKPNSPSNPWPNKYVDALFYVPCPTKPIPLW